MHYVEFTIMSIMCFIICQLSAWVRVPCLNQGTGLCIGTVLCLSTLLGESRQRVIKGKRDLLGSVGSKNSSQTWETESLN